MQFNTPEDRRAWEHKACGGTDRDPDRPRRIGSFLASAITAQDVKRIQYYRSIIDHMSPEDREKAVRGGNFYDDGGELR